MAAPDAPIVDDGQGGTPVAPPAQENQDLARLQRELANTQREVQAVRAERAVERAAPAPAAPVAGPTKEQIEAQFWKDPLPITQQIAQRAAYEAAAAVQASQMDNNKAIAREKARNDDPEFFDAYVVDIEAKVAQMPPQYQGQINIWQNAVTMTRGERADEWFQKKNRQKAGAPPVSTDGPAPPSAKAAPAPKVAPLSDDEKAVAKGLKIGEERYRRGKELLENQDNAWAKVVTFDSEAKNNERRAAAK